MSANMHTLLTMKYVLTLISALTGFGFLEIS